MPTKPGKSPSSDIQLRQWCISMALGWPSWEEQHINPYVAAQSNLGGLGGAVRTRKDADVSRLSRLSQNISIAALAKRTTSRITISKRRKMKSSGQSTRLLEFRKALS